MNIRSIKSTQKRITSGLSPVGARRMLLSLALDIPEGGYVIAYGSFKARSNVLDSEGATALSLEGKIFQYERPFVVDDKSVTVTVAGVSPKMTQGVYNLQLTAWKTAANPDLSEALVAEDCALFAIVVGA